MTNKKHNWFDWSKQDKAYYEARQSLKEWYKDDLEALREEFPEEIPKEDVQEESEIDYHKLFDETFEYSFGISRNNNKSYDEYNALHSTENGNYFLITEIIRRNLNNDVYVAIKLRVNITLEQWLFLNQRHYADKYIQAEEFIEKLIPEIIPVFELRTSKIPKRISTNKYLKVAEDTSFYGNYTFDDVEGEFAELRYAFDYFNRKTNKEYRIRLGGTDDDSWTKFFDSEEEYEKELDYLHFIAENGGVSKDYDITEERGYVFTN